MSKILINTTASSQIINDCGITIPASSQYTVPVSSYTLFAGSNDTVALVGAGTLAVSDGSSTLSIADGTALLQGLYPLATAPTDGLKATYTASEGPFSVTGNPTDLFVIAGSATKTIRVLHFSLAVLQNNHGSTPALLIKRTSGNSGGTAVSVPALPYDSTNPAATAAVTAYSVSPTTLGTSAGTYRAALVFSSEAYTPYPAAVLTWDFGTRPSQALVLRGASEYLAVNLVGQVFYSSKFYFSVEWTEE